MQVIVGNHEHLTSMIPLGLNKGIGSVIMFSGCRFRKMMLKNGHELLMKLGDHIPVLVRCQCKVLQLVIHFRDHITPARLLCPPRLSAVHTLSIVAA